MAAVYADNLLRTMRTMRYKCTTDPHTEVVMALHDALAYSNPWIDYTATQYFHDISVARSLLLSTQTYKYYFKLPELHSFLLIIYNRGFVNPIPSPK